MSSMTAVKTSWHCLPAEIRTWILEDLLQDGCSFLVLRQYQDSQFLRILNQHYPLAFKHDPIRVPTPNVSRAVAQASFKHEQLSASFIVDASYFFHACEPSWKWPNLTSLALTSRLLTPDESPIKIEQMLQSAAAVAMKMPLLRSMEIWNGRGRFAMLFRYQLTKEGQPAVITWRGTRALTLSSPVVEAWEAVALKHGGYRSIIVQELLDSSVIQSYGDAIHHLKLVNPVLRPLSLQQVRMEHRIREVIRSR